MKTFKQFLEGLDDMISDYDAVNITLDDVKAGLLNHTKRGTTKLQHFKEEPSRYTRYEVKSLQFNATNGAVSLKCEVLIFKHEKFVLSYFRPSTHSGDHPQTREWDFHQFMDHVDTVAKLMVDIIDDKLEQETDSERGGSHWDYGH